MTKCTACDFEATHIPRLLMFAFTGATPAAMFFNLPRCKAHAVTSPDQLLTTESWAGIVYAIVQAAKLAPKRNLCEVEMVPLRSHEAREFYRLLDVGRGQKITTPANDTTH